MKNVPYVKQYDADGFLINPIKGSYKSPYENRMQRRMHEKEIISKPFSKEGMVVIGVNKWEKRIQYEIGSKIEEGRRTWFLKKIYHQVLCTNNVTRGFKNKRS